MDVLVRTFMRGSRALVSESEW